MRSRLDGERIREIGEVALLIEGGAGRSMPWVRRPREGVCERIGGEGVGVGGTWAAGARGTSTDFAE